MRAAINPPSPSWSGPSAPESVPSGVHDVRARVLAELDEILSPVADGLAELDGDGAFDHLSASARERLRTLRGMASMLLADLGIGDDRPTQDLSTKEDAT